MGETTWNFRGNTTIAKEWMVGKNLFLFTFSGKLRATRKEIAAATLEEKT